MKKQIFLSFFFLSPLLGQEAKVVSHLASPEDRSFNKKNFESVVDERVPSAPAGSLPFLAQPLRERLKAAKNGDFIVTEANKMISLLVVRSLSSHTLILEEITAPASSLNPRPASWADWLKNRAPGHTSWSMMELDLSENQVLECYSFSRSSWVQLSDHENFFSTLLKLPLQAIPVTEQKRIGPPPSDGETDHRALWKPPLIVDGILLKNSDFDVYSAFWPKDGSDLSDSNLSLYFDRAHHSPFPVWIQVNTAHATAPLRVIDSGKNLPEIHRSFPRRVPQFMNAPQKTANGIKLLLKTPKYYKSFDLFAVDVTTRNRQIYPVTHSLVQGEGELFHVEISQEELLQTLQPNHRYTWLIVPTGHSEYYSESLKPFLWKLDE